MNGDGSFAAGEFGPFFDASYALGFGDEAGGPNGNLWIVPGFAGEVGLTLLLELSPWGVID